MATVILGDSITEYWDLDNYFVNTINKGVAGNTPQQMLDRIDDALESNPDQVLIIAGTNAPYVSSAATIIEMAEIARTGGAKVYLSIIPPRQWWIVPFLNELVKLAFLNGYPLVNFYTGMVHPNGNQKEELFTDGTHPNTLGYDQMAVRVKKLMRNI